MGSLPEHWCCHSAQSQWSESCRKQTRIHHCGRFLKKHEKLKTSGQVQGKIQTFMNLQTGGGSRSCRMREWVLISVATTSLRPSTSSPSVQMSMDSEARSPQVGIRASVSRTGRPKSSVTKRRAPGWEGQGKQNFLRLNDLLTVYIYQWTHVVTQLQCTVLTCLCWNLC